MSSEIYENRDAGLIVPQWRTRTLQTGIVAGAVGWEVPFGINAAYSDGQVLYFIMRHDDGVNRVLQMRATVDGTVYTSPGTLTAAATDRYFFLSDVADALLDDTNRTLAMLGVVWPFRSLAVEVNGLVGGVVYDLDVRMMQL